jgi:hypothetical protein
MSRTDKDRPYRIKVQDSTYFRDEDHDHRPSRRFCITGTVEQSRTYYNWKTKEPITRTWTERLGYYHYYPPACDLGDFPGEGKYYRWHNTHCGYSLPSYVARYHSTVPKWYVDHVWNNAERVRERSRLREAAKEWNANGDLDDYDFPNLQHRHRAKWLWD